MNKIFSIFSLALACACAPAFAEKDFSSWRKFSAGELIAESTAVAPGSTVTAGIRITLEGNWHTYWVNAGDSGTAIRLDFKNGPGVRVKAVHMPVPTREKSGPLISFAYGKEVVFPIELEIGPNFVAGQTAHVEVDAEWLICDEVCIPAIDTLKLDLPIETLEAVRPSASLGVIQKFLARVPAVQSDFPKLQDSGESVELKIKGWAREQQVVDFFPFRGSGVTNEKPEAVLIDDVMTLRFAKSNVPRAGAERVGVLVFSGAAGLQAVQFGTANWSFTEAGVGEAGAQLLWMLLSAFLGGLILNLMPCVFPILSIKLLSILKISAQSKSLVRKQNMGYVAGVMVSFLVIALVIAALRSAGHLVGWGFQLQSPIFLALLSWLFVLLSMNLWGIFEIDFIDSGIGGKWTRLGGFWGSFFTGVLAVVVASPCTAPFMGVATGFGISQPTPVLMAVFLSLGFGLAFPYALMTVVPSALWFLPKPGPWMEWVKKLLAVPLILTVVWLLWVLSQISGFAGLAAALVGCVIFALLVVIRIPKTMALSVGFLSAVALSLFVGSLANVKSENHGDWKPYDEKLMVELKGQNVFVNMTADWCLTCKVNERLIFADPDVLQLLKNKNVNLVMGDWTQRNEQITRFLSRYSRVGVPFYVLFSAQNPGGRVLPEVMTKSTFIEEIKKEFP